MRSEGHRWIKKQSYDKAMELLNKSEQLKNRAVTLASSRYLDALVTQFENNSKKAVWEVLHAYIKSYKSLGTFYQHTKGKNKREYLAELFSDHQLGEVFKIIRVSDDEIQELRTQAETLEKEAETLLHGN